MGKAFKKIWQKDSKPKGSKSGKEGDKGFSILEVVGMFISIYISESIEKLNKLIRKKQK